MFIYYFLGIKNKICVHDLSSLTYSNHISFCMHIYSYYSATRIWFLDTESVYLTNAQKLEELTAHTYDLETYLFEQMKK